MFKKGEMLQLKEWNDEFKSYNSEVYNTKCDWKHEIMGMKRWNREVWSSKLLE